MASDNDNSTLKMDQAHGLTNNRSVILIFHITLANLKRTPYLVFLLNFSHSIMQEIRVYLRLASLWVKTNSSNLMSMYKLKASQSNQQPRGKPEFKERGLRYQLACCPSKWKKMRLPGEVWLPCKRPNQAQSRSADSCSYIHLRAPKTIFTGRFRDLFTSFQASCP